MTSLFTYLHETLEITPLDDGNKLKVTITLPSDHFLHFLRILDSLTGFVHILNKHARLERIKGKQDPQSRQQQAKATHSAYYELIGGLFDKYTEQGLSRYEAIKQIGAELRSQNHPWSSPDLVRPALAESGRGGRPGRPRRKS